MADGDAAAAAGMDVVNGATRAASAIDDEINKSRDYLANHMTAGTHSADQITSGTLPLARGGTGGTSASTARTALGVIASNIPTIGSNVQADIDYVAGIANNAQKGLTTSDIYNRNITGTRRAVYADATGPLGYNLSTRAAKQDFENPDWTLEQLREIPILYYRYRAEVAKARKNPDYQVAKEIGTIADDLHKLGLWEFVIYKGRGESARPISVHYELLGLAALWLAQRAHDRIDELERRLTEKEI